MLPLFPRALIIAATTAALALGAAAPAQALGKNERNVLKGVAAAVIVQQIIHQANRGHAAPSRPQQPPHYPQHYPQQPRPDRPHGGYPGTPQTHYAPVQRNAAEQAFRDYGPQGRREIQRRLAAYGYYHGPIDGAWGRGTASAVALYARDTRAGQALNSLRGASSLYRTLLG